MAITDDVVLGVGVRIPQPDLVNLFDCSVGDATMIGPFVEIQSGAVIGARCKISSHSFVCSGVIIEDEVFIGHGVMFTNDRWPRVTTPDGSVNGPDDWVMETSVVERGATIGSNCVILPGVRIGQRAFVAAGSVVTKDVAPGVIVVGNPATFLRPVDDPISFP